MKLTIFIIGMLCMETMLYGQYCNEALFERKEQDSIAVDKLKKVHQKYTFGPIGYTIDMVEKVEKETDVPEVSKAQKKRVKTFKEKLQKLNSDITEAEERVDEMVALQNQLNQKVNSGEIVSIKEYDEERDKLNLDCFIKEQTRMQPKIEKQQSMRSWKVAWFYRFYKKKDEENLDDKKHYQHVPLLRSYLNADDDLDISSHEDAQRRLAEFRVLKDSFKILKDSVRILKNENKNKTDKLNDVKREFADVQKDHEKIEKERRILMDSLVVASATFVNVNNEKEQLIRILLSDQEELAEMKKERKVLEKKLEQEEEMLELARTEKETFEKTSHEKAVNLKEKIKILNQESEEIANKNKDLKKEQDDLVTQNGILKERNTKINLISLLFAILSSSLLIALILHHIKYEKQQQKSELKLKRANLNLERTNKKLNEKSNKMRELMRELNHRTKNNLNEISSLLLLQRNSTSDKALKSMLNKARNRVKTIGLIHQQLYRENTEELTTINLTVYVKELLSFILKDHPTHSDLKTSLMLDEIQMDMDLATKVGLVINELIQNIFNHAFKNVADPALSIEVTRTNGNLKIRVQNNGNGLPGNFDPEHDAGFGLKLVASLIEDGYLEYGSEDGTFFELTFPVKIDDKGVVNKVSHG